MKSMESNAVFVGVPVYNGGETIRAALDSLAAQTYPHFHVFISDNCSTDDTANIALEFVQRDSRFSYHRQATNIGAEPNFRFVLDAANAPYFMWAAADDVRSPDFLATQIAFLEVHSDYVSSTSPHCMAGSNVLITDTIEADLPSQRFIKFFEQCWISHGLFYGVSRTSTLQSAKFIGKPFLAFDWAVNLHMAKSGNMHKTESGLITIGTTGESSTAGGFKRARKRLIDFFIPFACLSGLVIRWSFPYPVQVQFRIWIELAKINVRANKERMFSALYEPYRVHIRPILRG